MEENRTESLQDHPTKPRSEKETNDLLNRLKRIEGQVRGVEKMVEEDRYCVDIIVQISAIQKALDKVAFQLLERHTHSCVAGAIKDGNGEAHIDELMKVIQQFSK